MTYEVAVFPKTTRTTIPFCALRTTRCATSRGTLTQKVSTSASFPPCPECLPWRREPWKGARHGKSASYS
jgi:hypothetical protein